MDLDKEMNRASIMIYGDLDEYIEAVKLVIKEEGGFDKVPEDLTMSDFILWQCFTQKRSAEDMALELLSNYQSKCN